MDSTTSGTKYTAMYNTFKTYCHGKDIDSFYDKENYQGKEKEKEEKEKSKTEQSFNPNNTNNSNNSDNYNKNEINDIGTNILIKSSDSNNNKYYTRIYELNRDGPMPKITEEAHENEETFFNEDPEYHDEYDEQYVKKINIYKFFIF